MPIENLTLWNDSRYSLPIIVRCGACYFEREYHYDPERADNAYICERCSRENLVQAIYLSCLADKAETALFWNGSVC